jgi:hypothetical protein
LVCLVIAAASEMRPYQSDPDHRRLPLLQNLLRPKAACCVNEDRKLLVHRPQHKGYRGNLQAKVDQKFVAMLSEHAYIRGRDALSEAKHEIPPERLLNIPAQ